MNYEVELHLFRGSAQRPYGRAKLLVAAQGPLSAMRRAEDLHNIHLPAEEYAAGVSAEPIPTTLEITLPVAA